MISSNLLRSDDFQNRLLGLALLEKEDFTPRNMAFLQERSKNFLFIQRNSVKGEVYIRVTIHIDGHENRMDRIAKEDFNMISYIYDRSKSRLIQDKDTFKNLLKFINCYVYF